MDEYVKRNDIINAFFETGKEVMDAYGPCYKLGISHEAIERIIGIASTQDVAPVVHGE